MSRRLWLLLLWIPAIAFLMIYVIVPRYFPREIVRGGPERTMLAVLPFENLGPSGEEYFADGITEELIAKLAKKFHTEDEPTAKERNKKYLEWGNIIKP